MKVHARRPVRAALWAATATLTLLASAVSGQADYSTLVPANSAYVAHVPKTQDLWNAWKGNGIYQSFTRLMEEPEFKEKAARITQEIKTIEEALGFPLDGENLSKIFSHGTIYVAPGENAGEINLGLIAGIADKERFTKLLDLAEKVSASMVQEQSDDEETTGSESEGEAASVSDATSDDEKVTPAAKKGAKKTPVSKRKSSAEEGADTDDATTAPSPVTAEEYSGVTFKRFATSEDEEFFYAVAKDTFIAAANRTEIKALIDRLQGKTDVPTLSTKADYKAALAGLQAKLGHFQFFTDAKASVELQQSQPGMDKFRDLFRKIVPVNFTATGVTIQPNQLLSYSFAPLAEGEGAELLKKYPGTTPLEIAKFAPSGAVLVIATSLLDAPLYYNILKEALGAAGTDPEQFEQQMQALEQTLGFSVKDDLIPALGNEFALIVGSLKMAGMMPDVEGTIAFKIADKAKLAKVTAGIDKLAAQMAGGDAKGGLKETKIGDATAKTMEIPNQPAYSPGYVVTGDYFLIGGSVNALRHAIESKADPTKGLTSDATYKRLAPLVTTTGNAFQFFNFDPIWDLLTPFTAFAGENAAQVAKILEAVKVVDAFGANSSVQGNAVVSQGVLLIGAPGSATPAATAAE